MLLMLNYQNANLIKIIYFKNNSSFYPRFGLIKSDI